MHADAGLAEAAPEDADGVVGAAGDVEGVVRALAGVEELLVVAPDGELDGGLHFPFSVTDDLGSARGDGENGDEALVGDTGRRVRIGDDQGAQVRLVDADLVELGVDDRVALAEGFVFLEHGPGEVLDLEGLDVGHDDRVARLEAVDFRGLVELDQEWDIRVVSLRHELPVAAVGHHLRPGLLGFLVGEFWVHPFGNDFRHDRDGVWVRDGLARGDVHGAPAVGGVALVFVPRFHRQLRKLADLAVDHTGAEVRLVQEDLEADGVITDRLLIDGRFGGNGRIRRGSGGRGRGNRLRREDFCRLLVGLLEVERKRLQDTAFVGRSLPEGRGKGEEKDDWYDSHGCVCDGSSWVTIQAGTRKFPRRPAISAGTTALMRTSFSS